MKNKLTAALTVIAVAAGIMPVSAWAENSSSALFEDGFESYTATDEMTAGSTDTTLAGNWIIPPKGEGQWQGYDKQGKFSVAEDDADHGNVLKVEARSAWATSNGSMFPMLYNSGLTTNADKAYTYQFDIKRKSDSGGGIRFNYFGSGSASSYYELYITRTVSDKNGVILSKVTNGSREQLAADIYSGDDIGTGTYWTGNNAIIYDEWYTVKLSVSGGAISWDVYQNTSTYNGVTLSKPSLYQHGMFCDPNFIQADGMKTAFFASGQGGSYTYFDNINVTEAEIDIGNFESFAEIAEILDSKQFKTLTGPWTLTTNSSGAAAAIEDLSSSDSTHGKVLKLESRAVYSDWNNLPTAINTSWRMPVSNEVNYSFDFKRSSTSSGGGIRFNYSKTDAGISFYELFFKRTDGNGKGWQLAKCVNGTYTAIDNSNVSFSQNANAGENQLLTENKWYRISVINNNGAIAWKVTDISTGEIWQTGSWTDSEPLSDVNTYAGLFAGGQFNEFAWFDNAKRTIVNRDRTDYSEYAGGPVFETFEDVDLVTDAKNGTMLSDDWKAVGGGYDGNANFSVIEDPTGRPGRIVKVESRFAHNYNGGGVTVQNETANFNQDDIYTYRFNYYRVNNQGGGGIRFNILDGSFYELFFAGDNNNGGADGTTLYKMVNGVYSRLDAAISTNDGAGNIVSSNKLNKEVWYTAVVTVEKGTISWTVQTQDGTVVQTGSYDDRPVTFTHMSYDGYKMAVFAAGQGSNYVYFDNIFVTQETSDLKLEDIDIQTDNETYITENDDGTVTFTDLFGGYDSRNAAVNKKNSVYANKYDLTVANNGEFKWVLSKKVSDTGANGAYINPITKKFCTGTSYPEGKKPTGADAASVNPVSAANMELENSEMKTLKSVQVTTDYSESCRIGIRFAVSGDEDSYYEIGCGDWWDATEDSAMYGGAVTGYPRRAPYVVKCVDGVRSMVAYKHETDDKFGNTAGTKTYSAEINGNNITVRVVTSAGTYETSFTDTDGILAAAKYPVALWSGSEAWYDDLSVTAEVMPKILTDNGDGTASVNIVPAKVKRGITSVAAITSFYNADGKMIGTPSERKIGSEGERYTVNVPDNAETRVIIYEGTEASGSPVKVVSSNEAGVKSPAQNKTVIAAIGDSNTGTWLGGVAYHTWPLRLGVLLGEDYEVHNFGKPGYRLMNGYTSGNPSYTTSDMYEESLKIDADIAIIMLGTNDFGWNDNDSAATEAANKKFYEDYLSLIDTYRNTYGADTQFILAVPPIRGTAENPDMKVPKYIRPIIQRISQEQNIPYVDIYEYMQDYDLLYDGLHFKPAAYYRFADCFYEAITNSINVSVTNNKVVINSPISFTGNVPVAIYKDGSLSDCKYFSEHTLEPSKDFTVDLSDTDIADADELKVMLWVDEMTAFTNASSVAVSDTAVNGNTVTLRGNTEADSDAAIVVYNSANEVVYADSAKADGSGYYSFSFTLPAGSYTSSISGTKAIVVE
ncbi:MAG: GDSL-type esterase/lipase family protein [Clostridiales bacterium]|nr:GDSL-type esterase/lipase family protein [Clostridiales bacterium]